MSESGQAYGRPGDLPALALDGVSPVEAASLLLDRVQRHVADIIGGATGQAPGSGDPERSFRELGLDSLGAVELHRRLTASTGLVVPVTVVFEYPSPATLTQHLVALVRGLKPTAGVVIPQAVTGEEPLAIVSLSCRYPGGVSSPEDLWQVVATGRDVIGAFPGDRGWDLEALYDADPDSHGTSYADCGGFLDQAAYFDLATLRGTRIGVFVGAEPQEYGPRLHEAPEGIEGYLLTGNTTSVMSGRISPTAWGCRGRP